MLTSMMSGDGGDDATDDGDDGDITEMMIKQRRC